MAIDNHQEEVSFHIIQSPHEPFVLGIVWLKQVNPHIHWGLWKILGCCTACLASCVRSAPVLSDPQIKDDPSLSLSMTF